MTREPLLVSVIIPAFNASATIADALGCCMRQSLSDIEVIVVDDGSTDDTAEHARAVCMNWEGVLKIVRVKHTGVPARVRNVGLGLASAPYVQFLDADDIITSSKLSLQVASLRCSLDESRTIAYSDYRFLSFLPSCSVFERRGPPDGDYWPQNLERQFGLYTVLHRFLFPRPLLLELGGFDEELTHAEDLDLWLRLLLSGAQFRYDKRVFAYYRERMGHSLMQPDKEARCRVVIAEKLLSLVRAAGWCKTPHLEALDRIITAERYKSTRFSRPTSQQCTWA
jgi:glycosyltransferase involved in cell wall biosynthesis